MNVNRRTQTERSAATRGQLIAAATPLFTEHGFGGVATETIVKAAGVTRGALYHQFADKTELFAAVVEEVEQGITGHIAEVVATSGLEDPMEAMKLGTEAWLDACGDPEVQQIIREVWPDDQEDKAIAIAWRESNWVPTVRNYCCIGLFQIYWNVHKSWLIPLGVKSSDMLFDPRINATAALALYQRAGGWAPWNL